MDIVQDFGSVAGFIALGLSIILGLRAIGVFDRPSYEIEASYLPERDLLGFAVMPYFIVQFRNDGNKPVTFADFELILPRPNVIHQGKLMAHLGAELFIDKRRSSRLGAMQTADAIDYRTVKVELPPSSSHTEFFDLGAFLPNLNPDEHLQSNQIPPDFEPVLHFGDSWRNDICVDRHGIHEGEWHHSDEKELAGMGHTKYSLGSTLHRKRRWLSRKWKIETSKPLAVTPTL